MKLILQFVVLEDRKANPIEKKDLLNVMLYGKDPKTGQGLSDDAIMRNVRLWSSLLSGAFFIIY